MKYVVAVQDDDPYWYEADWVEYKMFGVELSGNVTRSDGCPIKTKRLIPWHNILHIDTHVQEAPGLV